MEFEGLSRDVLADLARCVEGVDGSAVRALVDALADARQVTLVGTGRSGSMLAAMAIRLGHVGVAARCVGPDEPVEVDAGELVLVGSGSGRTPVPLEQAGAARSAGATIIAMTADPESPIAGLADHLIAIPAALSADADGPHTLRSLFEEALLVVCDCVCRLLADKLGVTPEDMQARHAPDR